MRRRGAFTLVAVDSLGQTDGPDSASRKKIHSPVPVEEVVGGFIVAEAGGRARGHVITIDVVVTARRSGVGSLLLRAAEDRLIVAGCRAVELETAVDNVSALSFYKRHGYGVSGMSANYYSNGVDALVLEKTLI